MECLLCKKEIPDGEKECPGCGWSVDLKLGVAIRKCGHCKGKGECRAVKTTGKTFKKIHSCEYCVKKAGVKMDSLFPIVPCGHCEGKGYNAQDLKVQAPKGEGKKQQGQGGKQNGRR
jgi:hypothetical protein